MVISSSERVHDCESNSFHSEQFTFDHNVLGHDLPKDDSRKHEEFLETLAASYRFGHTLVAPNRLESRFLQQEFELERLHNVTQWLWIAGRPVPPRPLHYQILLQRKITICERMDMHLVWGRGSIFLKPIPRFLLLPEFWKSNLPNNLLSTAPPTTAMHDPRTLDVAPHRSLRECALGFLVSYIALIAHESDFRIARDSHLIPAEVTWSGWKILVRQILCSSNSVQAQVADRFVYGELRLSRLNLIYFFSGHFSTTYLPRWNSYRDFYRDNLQLVIGSAAYIIIILSSLQVGLATDRLSQNATFQSVAYGLTVFSILGPLSAVTIIVLIFCVAFIRNWALATKLEKVRRQMLGRSWTVDGKGAAQRSSSGTSPKAKGKTREPV